MRARKERGRATEKALVVLENPKQNAGRTMNSKGHSDEVSDGNEEQIIGNQKKGDSPYIVAKNLAELCLCPIVL